METLDLVHKKIESGVYLESWNNYRPDDLYNYSFIPNFDIGENNYVQYIIPCADSNYTCWSSDINKMPISKQKDLINILDYRRYCYNFTSNYELRLKISNFFNCDLFHISRLNFRDFLKIVDDLYSIQLKVKTSSFGCLDDRTKDFIKKVENSEFIFLGYTDWKYKKRKDKINSLFE